MDCALRSVPEAASTVQHVCLQCGQHRCAPCAAVHAQRLVKKHPIVCVVGSWTVHCYACGVDTDASARSEGSVRDCVEIVNGIANSDAGGAADHTGNVTGGKKKAKGKASGAQGEANDDDDDDNDDDDQEVILVKPAANKGSGGGGGGAACEITSDALRAQLAKIDFASLSPGVVGLQNLGNTCFFNSVLQCLVQTPHLRATFLRPAFRPEPQLTRAFHSLLLQVWSKHGASVSPHSLLAEVIRKAPQFRGGRQQDSHELLRCLLDGMQEEELVRIKALQAALSSATSVPADAERKIDIAAQSTDNFVRDAFAGQLQSTVTCLTCLFPSVTNEMFYDLGLSVGPAAIKALARTPAPTVPRGPQGRKLRPTTKKQQKRLEKIKRQGAHSAAAAATTTAAVGDAGAAATDGGGDDDDDEEAAAASATTSTTAAEGGDGGAEDGDGDEQQAEARLLYYAAIAVDPSEPSEAPAAPLAPLDPASVEKTLRELDQRRAALAVSAFPSDSVQHALATFTAPELLDANYMCEQCDERRRAVKQACIQRAPQTLTLCLKRFRTAFVGKSIEMTKFGGHVDFPATLDLAPFCTAECAGSLIYKLQGVVVHSGGNTKSGHYVAYTRTSQGWHYFSDTTVRASSLPDALGQQAYLLFYERQQAEP
jgi:ubiquitin C-terminal hydrolase